MKSKGANTVSGSCYYYNIITHTLQHTERRDLYVLGTIKSRLLRFGASEELTVATP